ncbi:MAG: hypothetical protein C6W56_02250 [Caldibacillus debilis]|nr:MAG: hypothetical protein C6W56_02250 [Caldibacillus debilis]
MGPFFYPMRSPGPDVPAFWPSHGKILRAFRPGRIGGKPGFREPEAGLAAGIFAKLPGLHRLDSRGKKFIFSAVELC